MPLYVFGQYDYYNDPNLNISLDDDDVLDYRNPSYDGFDTGGSTNPYDQYRGDLESYISRRNVVRTLTGEGPTEADLQAQNMLSRIDMYDIDPDLANDPSLWGGTTMEDNLTTFSPTASNPFDSTPVQQQGFTTGQYENGLSGLYPTKLPDTSNGIEDIAIDFTSCIASIYAVNLIKIPIRAVQKILSSIGQGVGDMAVGSGFWTLGTGSLAAAPIAEKRTVEDEKKVEETGVTLMGVQIFPAMQSVAFCAKNMLIAYITATVEKWVAEAFAGAATFVEDLQADFNDIMNIAFEEAIGEINVCVHLRATVDLSALANALRLKPAAPPNRCTFVFDQHAKFMLEGKVFDFDNFESMYLNPNNNVMGAFLAVDSVYNTKYNNYKEKHIIELNWGNGVLPWKDDKGRTVTPGQFVMSKIQKILNKNLDTLSFANEWDEVMFIITNQIIKTNLQDAFN